MGVFEVAIGLAIVCMVAFQAWLTVRVFRSKMFERRQKVLQAQLIWLVPIIGAGLVFSILREDDAAHRDAQTHLRS